jgi:hypothetical protein
MGNKKTSKEDKIKNKSNESNNIKEEEENDDININDKTYIKNLNIKEEDLKTKYFNEHSWKDNLNYCKKFFIKIIDFNNPDNDDNNLNYYIYYFPSIQIFYLHFKNEFELFLKNNKFHLIEW